MTTLSADLMQAAVMHGAQEIECVKQLRPRVLKNNKDSVLIQVKAVGICGSDIHYFQEGGIGDTSIGRSFTPGHEFAGVVIEGTGETFGLSDGTLVAVDPAQPCGRCEWCHRGHHNLCPHHLFVGAPPTPGAMVEYIAVPASTLYPVPPSFTAQQAALLEPLGIAIHALDLAKLRPANDVVILGAGSIGLYLLMLAAISGAGRACVIEPLEYRRRKALELGAEAVFADVEAYLAFTGGRGADVVLEATTSQGGPAHATQAARIGGKVILVGIPEGNSFSLNASLMRRKGLTLKLSRRMGDVYPRAIQLVDSGKVELGKVLSHVMPLKDVKNAFELMATYDDGVIKVILEP